MTLKDTIRFGIPLRKQLLGNSSRRQSGPRYSYVTAAQLLREITGNKDNVREH